MSSSASTMNSSVKTKNERIDAEMKFVEREFIRMGFDKDARWRICDINKNFDLCNTYPRFLIIPSSFKDEDLESVAKFRYFRRVPTAVWRHLRNGCFIVRSSQPTVGWFGWFRNELDESLVQSYVNNTMPPSSESSESAPVAINNNSNSKHDDESVDNNSSIAISSSCNISNKNNHSDNKQRQQQQSLADRVQPLDGDKDSPNNHHHSPTTAQQNPETPFPNNNSNDTSLNSHNNNHADTWPIAAGACEEPTKSIVNVTDATDVEETTDKSQSKTPTSTTGTTTNGNGALSSSDNVTPLSSEKEDASTMTSKMLIIDARSYTAAMANRAKGGGCECSEYYQRCEIQFMNLANIHSIRKSYQAIRSVCESYSEQSNK